MSSVASTSVPPDYGQRIKKTRQVAGLTQAQLAKPIGVSYASVSRWENGQARPTNLAWRQIIDLELSLQGDGVERPNPVSYVGVSHALDFSAAPEVVSAVAEAHRLAYGHLFNPAFASETSLIDPLPHQRLAVYEQSPLQFLLADDAGTGKTIMTGLYVREMLARRLIRRVLIVPHAGPVGN